MLITRRTDDSKFTDWYYGIDRSLLLCVFLLIFVGIIAAVSTGSAMMVFKRGDWHWYYFLMKMFPFYIAGITGMLIVSMMNKKWILTISWINVIVCLILLALTKIRPCGTYGSERWVCFFGNDIKLMPSDLLKPGLVMITAWFITKMKEKFGEDIFIKDAFKLNSIYNWWTFMGVFGFVVAILVSQPDIGTTMLYCCVVGLMLIIAGLPKLWICYGATVGIVGGLAAYLFQDHVRARINAFLKPIDSTTQIGQSITAIRQGGLFGMGDEANAVENLPMAENDFVYAALVENWGAVGGIVLICCFVYMLQRLITDARGARDSFVFYGISGVAFLFVTQIAINLATTLRLMPTTGITLPFISFGGSSFLSFCLLFGMALAIVREDKWK